MHQITQANLQALCDRINKMTSNNPTPYTRNEEGKFTANIGNYHLDGAYGGWKLVQIVNECGGIISITDGYVSKRELHNLMFAFIKGVESRS